MWVRKTPGDIECEYGRLWRAVGGPTVCFLFCFVGSILAYFCPVRSLQTTVYRSPGEAICFAMAFAVTTWIGAYSCQFVFRKPVFSLWSRKAVICNACYRVKFPDGRDTCDCGGRFEDFGLWKWAEDDGAEGRDDP